MGSRALSDSLTMRVRTSSEGGQLEQPSEVKSSTTAKPGEPNPPTNPSSTSEGTSAPCAETAVVPAAARTAARSTGNNCLIAPTYIADLFMPVTTSCTMRIVNPGHKIVPRDGQNRHIVMNERNLPSSGLPPLEWLATANPL